MRRLKYELKILGINPVLIWFSVVVVFALLSALGGDLLRLSCIGFEVVFPILTSMAVSEWGKSRADNNFDIIVAQSQSLFQWVLYRFTAVFMEAVVAALFTMLLVSVQQREMPVSEMCLLYFSPALFLSTVSVFGGMCFSQEHIATLFCGMLWMFVLMARSLVQLPGVQYFYLFICFAGDQNDVWVVNKGILCVFSLLLWGVVYWICDRKGGYHKQDSYLCKAVKYDKI